MKIKDIKEEIKKYFFVNPTAKIRVRQIEKELKLPLPSVIRYAKDLEKEEILKKEKVAGVVLFSADRVSKYFLLEKKIYNLKQLYESGLVEYLVSELSNPVIIVFGSYSKGEDFENSDIDLYIQTPSKKEIKLEKFEKLLKRRIQLFIHSNLKKVNNPHLMNNIINGMILNNFIEVFT
ncbi:nucleotidyltransferase domain-containing protein [Candidatus Pacearchaeota archaeon]|nr:nucleotidyltransferase domain-containing protein [Candidatus Pacearchaeota archaeon]